MAIYILNTGVVSSGIRRGQQARQGIAHSGWPVGLVETQRALSYHQHFLQDG